MSDQTGPILALNGCEIFVVEAGTVINDLEVTDEECVVENGKRIYVSPTTWDFLKANSERRQ